MEQRVHGHAADLGRAVRAAARAEALQPADRPVRARRHHVEHLLRLDDRARLPDAGRHRRSWREFLQTFGSSRRARRPPSFTIDQVIAKFETRLTSGPMMLSSWNEGAGADGDPRLRRPRQRGGRPGLRAARRAGRRARQRRHAVVREARPTSSRCSSSPACARRPRSDRSWPSSPVVKALVAGDLAGASAVRHWTRSPGCCSSSTRAAPPRSSRATRRPWLAAAEHPRFGVPFRRADATCRCSS